jgi:hypothetical protein
VSFNCSSFEQQKDVYVPIVFVGYMPIIALQDWVAVLNSQGAIVGYVQGDGF